MKFKNIPITSFVIVCSFSQTTLANTLNVHIDNSVSSDIHLSVQANPKVVDGLFSVFPNETGFQVTSSGNGLGFATVTYNFLNSDQHPLGYCTLSVQARENNSLWASAAFSGSKSSGPYECVLVDGSFKTDFKFTSAIPLTLAGSFVAGGIFAVSSFLRSREGLRALMTDFDRFASDIKNTPIGQKNLMTLLRISDDSKIMDELTRQFEKQFASDVGRFLVLNQQWLEEDNLQHSGNYHVFRQFKEIYSEYFSSDPASRPDFQSERHNLGLGLLFTKMAQYYFQLLNPTSSGRSFAISFFDSLGFTNPDKHIADYLEETFDDTVFHKRFGEIYFNIKEKLLNTNSLRLPKDFLLAHNEENFFNRVLSQNIDAKNAIRHQENLLKNSSFLKENLNHLRSQVNALIGQNTETGYFQRASFINNHIHLLSQLIVENNIRLPNQNPIHDQKRQNIISLFAGAISLAGFAGTLLLASPALKSNQLTVRVQKKPDPGAFAVLGHTSTPAGEGVLSDTIAALHVPGQGYRLLAPPKLPNDTKTNPLLYPMAYVLAGSPTATPEGCSLASGRSLVVVPTVAGLSLAEFDHLGNFVDGRKKTLFQGALVEHVSLFQDPESGRCAAVAVVQATADGAKSSDRSESKIYMSRMNSPGLSVESADQDFSLLEHSAFDHYGHSFFASSDSDHLQTVVVSASGVSEVKDAAGLETAGRTLRLFALPNGHVLAAMENGVFYSTKNGEFLPAPSAITELFAKGYNRLRTLVFQENEQESRLILLPENVKEQNLRGAYVLALPASDTSSADLSVIEQIFPEKFIVHYDELRLFAVTADHLTEEGNPLVFLEHWFDRSARRFITIQGGDKGPEPGSPYLFLASHEGDFFRVDNTDGSKVFIPNYRNIKYIERLWLAETLFLVEQNETLHFTDRHGAPLGKPIDLLKENNERFSFLTQSLDVNTKQERLFISTDNGLHLLLPQVNTDGERTGYAHATNLLEGMGVQFTEINLDGYLIATLDGDFEGVRMISDVPAIEMTQDHAYAFSQID